MSERWRIELLGGLRAVRGKRTVSRFRSRQTASLLAYLALHSNRRHPREVLADLFWPECDYRTGLSRLSTAVWALRRVLEAEDEGDTPLVADRQSVGLSADRVTTDVAAFEEAARTGRSEQGDDRVSRLKQAIALYRGEFLPGHYEDWVVVEQRRLAELHREALSALLAALEADGRLDEASEYARRGLQCNPLEEEIHRELMRLHLARGHPEQALRQYADLRELLKRELDTVPAPGTRAVARKARQATLAPAETSSISPATGSPPCAGLPAPLTRFFGREGELQSLQQLLVQADARLVTVTGPGGAGKTRLALEAARGMARDFAGRVWFVELADLTDPARVAETVLRGVVPQGEPGGDAMGALIARLRGGPGLLVLDNLEHLLTAGGELCQQLLQRLADLHCLVTSRRRLGILGERLLELGPLPAPLPGSEWDDLAACPSVRMLADRAAAVSPGFELTADNATAVAELCRELEGIPLALELAGARLATMTPEEMVGALGRRFDVLVTNDNHRARRHQSVRATMEYTTRLLSEDCRRLLASLSVFRGGWSARAAREVCRQTATENHLAELRDSSLILAERRGPEMRFRMLETVRELAGEHLGVAEKDRLRERHARYFRDFAGQAADELEGQAQQTWLDRLDADLDNLRAALAWSLQAHPVWALRTAACLAHYYEVRGLLAEGRDWLTRALVAAPRAPRPARMWGELQTGWLSFILGEGAQAEDRLRKGLSLARDLGDGQAESTGVYYLANLARAREDKEESRRLHGQNLAFGRRTDSPPLIMQALEGLAGVAEAERDWSRAGALHQASLDLKREHGSTRSVALTLRSLGYVEGEQGDYDAAQRHCEEALGLFLELGDACSAAGTRVALGVLALQRGDPDVAQRELESALAVLTRVGSDLDAEDALFHLGETSLAQREVSRAREYFERCLSMRAALGGAKRLEPVLLCLAEAAQEQGDAAGELRYLTAVEGVRRELDEPPPETNAADRIAALRRQLGPEAADAVVQTDGLLRELTGLSTEA